MRRFINSLMVACAVLFASCTEMSEVAVYDFDQFYFNENEAVYNGPKLVKNSTLFGENYISVSYYSYETKDIEITIENIHTPDGVTLETEYVIPAMAEEGVLNIYLTGMATTVESTYISFEMVSGDNRWYIRIDDISVLDTVDAVAIRNVLLKGPIFDDETYYAESFQLSFDYANADSGYSIAIASVEGYIVPYDEYFDGSTLYFELNPNGENVWTSYVAELPDNFFDYTVGDLGYSESLPTYKDLTVKLRYNETYLAEGDYSDDQVRWTGTYVDNPADYVGYVQKDMYVAHMVSKGIRYKTITLDNGQVWLDRNVGATSIIQNPVYYTNGNGTSTTTYYVSDSWVPNLDVYGDYFLYPYDYGISMYRDNTNPLPAQATYSVVRGVNDYPLSTATNYALDGVEVIPYTEYYTIPYFNYGGTWEENCFTEADCADGYVSSITTFWNDSEDGGTSNPCPEGYRLPTNPEVESMINSVVKNQTTSTSNNYVIKGLIENMNFALSGSIYRSGITATLANLGGNRGTVGLIGIGNSTYTMSAVNKPSVGEIYITTCTIDSETTYYLKPVVVGATGIVTYETGSSYSYARKGTSGPIRCIRHQ